MKDYSNNNPVQEVHADGQSAKAVLHKQDVNQEGLVSRSSGFKHSEEGVPASEVYCLVVQPMKAPGPCSEGVVGVNAEEGL